MKETIRACVYSPVPENGNGRSITIQHLLAALFFKRAPVVRIERGNFFLTPTVHVYIWFKLLLMTVFLVQLCVVASSVCVVPSSVCVCNVLCEQNTLHVPPPPSPLPPSPPPPPSPPHPPPPSSPPPSPPPPSPPSPPTPPPPSHPPSPPSLPPPPPSPPPSSSTL